MHNDCNIISDIFQKGQGFILKNLCVMQIYLIIFKPLSDRHDLYKHVTVDLIFESDCMPFFHVFQRLYLSNDIYPGKMYLIFF